MEQEKMIKWAAVGVGLVISVAVLWIGFMIVQGRFGNAANLTVTNFSCEPTGENALLVTWEDSSKDKGVAYYRPAGTTNDLIALEETVPAEANGSNSHEITLSLLTPGTSYEVRVGTGGQPTDEVHSCKTNDTQTSTDRLIPTASVESEKSAATVPSAAPTTQAKLSVNEIEDRYRDGSFKNTADCASSSQTTALDCAKAAKALNAAGSVSR